MIEKLDFRVLQEWPYGDLRLACLSPAKDDDFQLELPDRPCSVDLIGNPSRSTTSAAGSPSSAILGNMIELSETLPGAGAVPR